MHGGNLKGRSRSQDAEQEVTAGVRTDQESGRRTMGGSKSQDGAEIRTGNSRKDHLSGGEQEDGTGVRTENSRTEQGSLTFYDLPKL